jgi:hypothetical protein
MWLKGGKEDFTRADVYMPPPEMATVKKKRDRGLCRIVERRARFNFHKAPIFWVTHILAYGFLVFEIYLLAVKRGGDAVKTGDHGTLRLVWILIGGGCLVGFLLAPKFSFFRWPENLAIVLLADLLLLAGIVLRIWAIVHLGNFYGRRRYSVGAPRGSRWPLSLCPTSVVLWFDAGADGGCLPDLQLAGVPSHHRLFAGCLGFGSIDDCQGSDRRALQVSGMLSATLSTPTKKVCAFMLYLVC